MTDLLLLGILIMQIITFHYNASGSGRYMKYYDLIAHQLNRYLRRKAWLGCCKGYSKGKVICCEAIVKGKETYPKVRGLIHKVKGKLHKEA